MKKEDKELILRYICAAMPNGVYVKDFLNGNECCRVLEVRPDYFEQLVVLPVSQTEKKNPKKPYSTCIENVRPYIRKLSSITAEERNEMVAAARKDYIPPFGNTIADGFSNNLIPCGARLASNLIGWFLKNGFDYLGLSDNGLGVEITEENNPHMLYDNVSSLA